MKENYSFTFDINNPALLASLSVIVDICKIGWSEGLMRGWSGNASILADRNIFLITPAGYSKGFINTTDCVAIDMQGNIVAGNNKPSSEWKLHAAIYAAVNNCHAILHTHPVNMQALDLILAEKKDQIFLQKNYLNLNLFECDMWRKKLTFAPPSDPGSKELATSAIESLLETYLDPAVIPLPCGIWLGAHGLCSLGADLPSTLYFTEELEHLAQVQIKTLSANIVNFSNNI